MDIIFLGGNDIGFRIYEWLCERNGVNVLAMVTEADQLDLVEEHEPDVVVSVGFSHLVPPSIIEIPPQGALNLHPSLLPHNRGKSPNVWPIVEGTPAGATLHYMDAEFDTGDIVAQREVATDFSDTGKDLYERLEDAQFELFTNVWSDIEAEDIDRTPQDPQAGSYHSVDDFRDLCELDPNETVEAKDLLDRLRALTFPPFDNAYLEIDGDRYYIDIEIRKETEESGDRTTGTLSSY
jgi:methionyl-tRNA formyltransferase